MAQTTACNWGLYRLRDPPNTEIVPATPVVEIFHMPVHVNKVLSLCTDCSLYLVYGCTLRHGGQLHMLHT